MKYYIVSPLLTALACLIISILFYPDRTLFGHVFLFSTLLVIFMFLDLEYKWRKDLKQRQRKKETS